ncbi:MAG: Dabb family protein [Lachnospiraceae bacterium]|nr:Dabb family protein [Lachnospiraceae bacterium]
MVKHVILWQIKDEYSDSEKAEIKKGVKEGLEGLLGKVPGLTEIKVYTEGLESSNADLMLDSTLESEDALKGYQKNPDHVDVANSKVRPFMKNRVVMDYVV